EIGNEPLTHSLFRYLILFENLFKLRQLHIIYVGYLTSFICNLKAVL
ncbi:hypothetical protein PNI0009_02386, partial [Streptococcus pneumoniae PNI0009]